MAKRYKEVKNNKRKIIICILIILVMIAMLIYFFEKRKAVIFEQSNGISENQRLESDLLKIDEVKEELRKILKNKIEGIPLTKVIYKLKTLENGKVNFEYSNDESAVNVEIDIKSKKIMSIKTMEENNKEKMIELIANCDENIVANFYSSEKERKQKDDYIYITVTEIEVKVDIVAE